MPELREDINGLATFFSSLYLTFQVGRENMAVQVAGNAVPNPLIDKLRRYTDPNAFGTKTNLPGNPGVQNHLHYPPRMDKRWMVD